MPNDRLTPRDLDTAPELAALAVLDAAIDTTVDVLCTVDQGLIDDERPYWLERPSSQRIAERIVMLSTRLQQAIAQYRRATVPSRQVSDPPAGPLDF